VRRGGLGETEVIHVVGGGTMAFIGAEGVGKVPEWWTQTWRGCAVGEWRVEWERVDSGVGESGQWREWRVEWERVVEQW